MDNNGDLHRRLQRLAGEASPRPGAEDTIIGRSRVRRRMVAAVATLTAVVVIGGLAGAGTLLGDRGGIDAAPGPAETSACAPSDYDVALFIPEQGFHDKVAELRERLREHDEVVRFEFVSASKAFQEYRRQDPGASPVPTQARVSQYQVKVEPGTDPQLLSQGFAALIDGTHVPAQDCLPAEPEKRFARYFLEVDEGNASASGVLEVDAAQRSVCLNVQTRNIKASHLLFRDPDRADSRGTIVLTFFDPNDDEVGDSLAPTGNHCFTDDQLGELDDELLARLINSPKEFRIDFHRGPNDEPGLVAGLMLQAPAEERSARCGFPLVRPTYLPWLEANEAPGHPRRSYDPAIDRAQLSWQRGSDSVGLSAYPEDLDTNGERIGVRVEGVEGYLHRGEGGTMSVSWDLSARCNLLELGLSLPDADQNELERHLIKIARSLERTSDARPDGDPEPTTDSANVVYFALNPDREAVDRYCGAYDRSYVQRVVEVPERDGPVLTHALRSLFHNEWGVPRSRIQKVDLAAGHAVVYVRSAEGLGFASTSCGGVGFLGSILRTAFQFDSVDSVEVRLRGSCERFGKLMQTGRCEIFSRQDLRRRTGG